jgi:putative MFS transporter
MSSNNDISKKIEEVNTRIDRLPTWALSPLVLIIVGFSYFFAFYDIAAFGYSLSVLIKALNITTAQTAIPASLFLIGYVLGAPIVGTVADLKGRRMGLLLTVAILAIGALLTAISWNLISFTIFRFITGLGVGAEIAIAATIISEFSPPNVRGRYLQLNYFWGAIGLGVSPFLVLFLLSTPLSWRLVFGFSALVAIVMLFLRSRFLPESPRWLAVKGKIKEALDVVQIMEDRIRRTGKSFIERKSESEFTSEKVPISELFKKPYRFVAILILLFWIIWYVTVYAWLGYEPYMITQLGIALPSGLFFVALSYLGFPLAALIAFLTVELWQRKYLIMIGALLLGIGSLILSFSKTPIEAFIGSFIGTFAIAYNSVAYVYTAEVFPTRMRATGTSFSDGIGHIGGAIGPFVVVASLSAFSVRPTFIVLAIIVLISGMIILLGPKTTRKPLTSISK